MVKDAKSEDVRLGQRVKALRGERGMTLEEGARYFKVSMSTICRIERGESCSYLTRAQIEKLLPAEVKVA